MTDTCVFINVYRRWGAAQLNIHGFSILPYVSSVLQVIDFEV